MKVTDKMLIRAMRNAVSFDIRRYLLVNSPGRGDGFEKAERHRELCKYFVSVLCDLDIEKVNSLTPEYKVVHTGTQELTGYLDKEIGLPLSGDAIDFDDLEPKFFDRFYELAVKSLKEYKSKNNKRKK